ncbi:MAG: alpha/beta hydrolase [Gammaproteobacteria bacterium]|nr:alpha/beta hydrolase [Gammaproteobacteria bacterium]
MKLIWAILAIVGIAYIGVCIFLFLFQARVIFFPDLPGRQLEMFPNNINLAFEDVYAKTEDGEIIHGWYVPAENATVTMLFSHGNAGNISHRLESIALYNSLGMNVLIYDYRGYGQSTGKISEQGFYQDIDAMWRVLTEQKGIRAENIILFGRSLGAAIASQLATRVKAGAVIIESPFTSVPDMGAKLYPFLPVRLLSRFQLSNIIHASQAQSPVLVVHSRHDEIIPFSHGEKVFESAAEPRVFLPISGDHNGGFLLSGNVYIDGLQEFLVKYVATYKKVN